jgi:hypothetical protein
VRKNNDLALQWHHERGYVGDIYKVHMEVNCKSPLAPNSRAEAAANVFLNQRNFHELTSVAVGAPVIYTSTDSKTAGSSNSKLATVIEVITSEPPAHMALPPGTPWVSALRLRLEGGKETICRRTRRETSWPNGVEISKSSFHIALAFAMTGHKAQVCSNEDAACVSSADTSLLATPWSQQVQRNHARQLRWLQPLLSKLPGLQCPTI